MNKKNLFSLVLCVFLFTIAQIVVGMQDNEAQILLKKARENLEWSIIKSNKVTVALVQANEALEDAKKLQEECNNQAFKLKNETLKALKAKRSAEISIGIALCVIIAVIIERLIRSDKTRQTDEEDEDAHLKTDLQTPNVAISNQTILLENAPIYTNP